MAEIRRLLDALLPHPRADRDRVAHTLKWSAWRRRRQAIARRCHYRKRSSGHEPLLEYYPTSSPTAAPLIVARCTKSQCRPCPVRSRCTSTVDSARTVGFPPRELRDLQLRVRTEQQTPQWKARYAVRSGVEGTVNEFAHGHSMRRCRYRGQGKAHVQHVLTAIVVNIERLSGLSPTKEAPMPRRPTAFQNYLDRREIPRPKSWRSLGS
ncbi:transposase [Streptomyces rishiriensis]|uniref:transposase n=1 Tax=Streptomyces rishiriensis TaxID=68264 RepID=UPI0037A71501